MLHHRVGNLVLPADVVAKTPVMELLQLFFMSPVDGPSFTSVHKCGLDAGALCDFLFAPRPSSSIYQKALLAWVKRLLTSTSTLAERETVLQIGRVLHGLQPL